MSDDKGQTSHEILKEAADKNEELPGEPGATKRDDKTPSDAGKSDGSDRPNSDG